MEVVLSGSNRWKLKDDWRILSDLPKLYRPMHYLKNSIGSAVGWISAWQISLHLLMTRQNCLLSWLKLVTMNFSYLHWWHATSHWQHFSHPPLFQIYNMPVRVEDRWGHSISAVGLDDNCIWVMVTSGICTTFYRGSFPDIILLELSGWNNVTTSN